MSDPFILGRIAFGLLLLAWLWLWLVPLARRDLVAQRLRRVRDKLFDAMRRKGYRLDHPAVCQTEALIEASAVTVEKFSPWLLLILHWLMPKGMVKDVTITYAGGADDGEFGVLLRAARQDISRISRDYIFHSGVRGLFSRLLLSREYLASLEGEEATTVARPRMSLLTHYQGITARMRFPAKASH